MIGNGSDRIVCITGVVLETPPEAITVELRTPFVDDISSCIRSGARDVCFFY